MLRAVRAALALEQDMAGVPRARLDVAGALAAAVAMGAPADLAALLISEAAAGAREGAAELHAEG